MAGYKQSEENQKLAEHLRWMFEQSFRHYQEDFRRMEDFQRAYEGRLPDNWSTYSQIYLPYIRTAVEQMIPTVFNYLFPTSGFVSLIPKEPMPFQQVQPVRDYLENLLLNEIGLKKEGIKTLKDCCKFNVGYGMIDTVVETPLDVAINTIFSVDGQVKDQRMVVGAEKEAIKYKYVNWRRVVPTPDGDSPENVSGVFHLDSIREDVFEAMYRADEKNDKPVLMGDPKEIIESVRAGKCSTAHFPVGLVMTHFFGANNDLRNVMALNEIARKNVSDKTPVEIPVLKCYFKKEHIWMTPDKTVIYHQKEGVETLRCPIIRACACPDGGNWFPRGDIDSGRDAADGANVFINALMDLTTYSLHPTTIVNRMAVGDEDVNLEPYGQIYVNGKIGDAVSFAQPPPMQQGIFGIGQNLEQQFNIANGQPMALQGQGTAGVMRGGGGAFESFLQTTMARAKFAGAVLQMSWLEEVVAHTLIKAQILGMDDSYISNDEVNKCYIEKTITADELRRNFKVIVNLNEKFSQSPSDRAMDMALYREVLKDNPNFDWTAIGEWVLQDANLASKLRASPEVKQAQIEQMQAAQEAAQQAKQGGRNELNPGEQALQGGASQSGGIM